MKDFGKKLTLLLIFLLFVSLSPSTFAKSYSYDYLNVNLDFQPNGDVIVTQERAYDFSGSFSYAYLDILKKGAEDVQFLGVTDIDNNSIAYSLENDARHVKATWHYSADYEVKKFVIRYRISGAVKRYADVAEFYWKVIEDDHERIGNLNVDVNLPSSSPNLFKIFVHSSASPRELKFSDDLTWAHVAMKDVPKDTFAEFRVLAEPSVFTGAPQIAERKYESILSDEKLNVYGSYVAGFLRTREALAVLLAIPFAVFLYYYLKYGREPKVDYDVPYEHEPPSNIPPMALSNLMEGEEEDMGISIEARGILATLFDLARRGHLEVRETKKKRFLGLMDKTEQVFAFTEKGKKEMGCPVDERTLESFEHSILSFLKSCNPAGYEITASQITEYCRKHGIPVMSEIESIDQDARSWFEKKYFPITNEASKNKRTMFTIFMISYSGFLGVYFLELFNPLAIKTIFFGALLGGVIGGTIAKFLSMPISKRTPQSALEIKRWKAFRRFISDFSAMKDAPAALLGIWDEYLVYAIALGVAEKLLENIKKLSMQRGTPIAAVGWYHGASPISGRAINPQAISEFIDNLSGTISALNSSTSVGGGFSGGGGGGGGGGGSGAG